MRLCLRLAIIALSLISSSQVDGQSNDPTLSDRDRKFLTGGRTSNDPLQSPLNTIGDFFGPGYQDMQLSMGTTQNGVAMFGGDSPYLTGEFYRMYVATKPGFPSPHVMLEDGTFDSAEPTYLIVNGVTVPIAPAEVRSTTFPQIGLNGFVFFPGAGIIPMSSELPNSDIAAAIQSALGNGTLTLGQLVAKPSGASTSVPGPYSATEGAVLFYLLQEYTYTSGPLLSPILLQMNASPGQQTGRYKSSNNNSPMPRDRFFFDYGFLNNASLTANGVDVSRFAPGVEKTLLGGLHSIELRVPMAVTLNSTTIADSSTGFETQSYELGNLALATKSVLLSDGTNWLTGGVAVQLPTAQDTHVNLRDGTQLVEVTNRSVRIMPYLATLNQTNSWFWQNFVQVDVGANGNPVLLNHGQGLVSAGRLNDQTFLYLDSSLSRWMVRNYSSQFGLALTSELHYNATVSGADVIQQRGYLIGSPNYNANVLNATFGGTAVKGKTTFTTGYGVPLSSDRAYDGELRVNLNRFF